MEARLCVKCGNPLPTTKRTDAIYCSSACGNIVRGRRHYDPSKEAARRANLKRHSYARKMLYAARNRAIAKGIEFTIGLSDIVIPEVCPVLGIVLDSKASRPGYHAASPSLDRVDNSKGYVPGNVCVISSKANTIKRGYSKEELRACADYIERFANSHG